MPIPSGHLVRSRMDGRKVDVAPGVHRHGVPFKTLMIHVLQVLISIQSMILCDEPYLNEPGWANEHGTPASKACTSNRKLVLIFVTEASCRFREC